MNLSEHKIKKVKKRTFIIGIIVFLVTLIIFTIILRNWDNLKTIIFGI